MFGRDYFCRQHRSVQYFCARLSLNQAGRQLRPGYLPPRVKVESGRWAYGWCGSSFSFDSRCIKIFWSYSTEDRGGLKAQSGSTRLLSASSRAVSGNRRSIGSLVANISSNLAPALGCLLTFPVLRIRHPMTSLGDQTRSILGTQSGYVIRQSSPTGNTTSTMTHPTQIGRSAHVPWALSIKQPPGSKNPTTLEYNN